MTKKQAKHTLERESVRKETREKQEKENWKIQESE